MKQCLVLIYHRVIDLYKDPQMLAVNPKNFSDQIEYLQNRFKIISLKDLAKKINSKDSLNNCIAITFDDGYADNLYFALPILERFQARASFFITAGMIGSDKEFWWDELERIFLTINKKFLPFDIEIYGDKYKWEIPDPKSAEGVYRDLRLILKKLPYKERESLLEKLFKWRGIERNTARGINRILNEAELENLSANDMVEIGSHSFSHSALSIENNKNLNLEIAGSKQKIESISKKKIFSFSYPFGQKTDFNSDIINKVKQAGFSYAVTNIQKNIDDSSDIYMIPRRLIRNWNLTEFKSRIDSMVFE